MSMSLRREARRFVFFVGFLGFFGFVSSSAVSQVPDFEEVVGHGFGERITEHHQMVRYLERLADASPRVSLVDQGDSWEGRKLLMAIVTSPENHARIDEILETAQLLADPRRVSLEEARELIKSQPAIVWLGGSIHGFELSGTEGLLKLLERLTTKTDDETMGVLGSAVVLIDPILNPDGRDAFAQKNHQNLGREPNPRREDWANDFSRWEALKYRTGHYYFDTNRDWFAQTQPETRHRVRTLLRWRPLAMVDAHEMGPNTEFFFDPPTEPTSPFLPEFARTWLPRFGAEYAKTFDRRGFEYTTRDLFNYFYPGYTSSYGSFQGAVSMLFEQGSSRGLALEISDESVRTLGDALEHQASAAWTTVWTCASFREELLSDYHDSLRSAVEEGRHGVRRYLLSSGRDPGLSIEAVEILLRNGIEVHRLLRDFELEGLRDRLDREVEKKRFPAGTWVIEAGQPRNRLVRTLFEAHTRVPKEFLVEARARIDRGEGARFYDMTAWSLPLLFNLESYGSRSELDLPVEPVTEEDVAAGKGPTRRIENAPYAYLLDGRQAASVAGAYHLRARGYRVIVTVEETQIEGESVAAGTVVVRSGQGVSGSNGEGDEERLRSDVESLGQRYRLGIRTVSTGRSDDAKLPSLGHARALRVKLPEIGLLAEQPVHGYSFGWAWHTLDQQYRIPTSVLRTSSLRSPVLHDYDVLIVPDLFSPAELGAVIGNEGKEHLKAWVREGGCLVAIGGAVDFVRQELHLTDLRSFYPEEKRGSEPDTEKKATVVAPQRIGVPGAFFSATLEPTSWMTAGYSEPRLPVFVFSDRVYLAPEKAPSGSRRVVAAFSADVEQPVAGHAWSESLDRIAGAVAVYEERIGRGRVIAFAEDPNFRGYLRGVDRLFLNAVVLGPSAP